MIKINVVEEANFNNNQNVVEEANFNNRFCLIKSMSPSRAQPELSPRYVNHAILQYYEL